MHFIGKKKYNKKHATKRIVFTKKQNDILSQQNSIQSFHSISIVDFFLKHYPVIFWQFITLPSILSICLSVLQKITYLLLQNYSLLLNKVRANVP